MHTHFETSRDDIKKTDCWLSVNNTCDPHFHSSLELTYVTEGTLCCVLNGETYTLKAHEMLLCPSYSLHQNHTDNKFSKSIVMTIPLDFVPSFKKRMEHKVFALRYAKLDEDNELLPHLLALSKKVSEGEISTVLLKGYTYLVLGLLMDILGVTEEKTNISFDFQRNVLLYLDKVPLNDISLQDTACYFGYSKSHFMHLFSLNFGMGFHEYVNILRCQYAACLMMNENLSLLEVAFQAGFQNVRSFYRNFKKAFNVTPSTYVLREKKLHAEGETPQSAV